MNANDYMCPPLREIFSTRSIEKGSKFNHWHGEAQGLN